jgi:poly(A) polymerase Pap1
MAKEDYLEGYGQGLKRGKENPITGPINKVLDKAFGNPRESAKRGLDQGYDEMKKAKKMEADKDKIINKTDKEVAKFDENYKKGGVIKDLKKAGFYDAKKDKAKRLNIINKVTTKPQRIDMVDKMFSAKKMSSGGTASSRADGIATKGKTRGKIC